MQKNKGKVGSEAGKSGKLNEELREDEARYHSLFENATIGLYRTTPDGQILLANPTIVQLLGYDSFDDLASRNLEQDSLEPDNQRNQFRELIETTGAVKGLESIWKRKDGLEIYVRESAKAIRDENGKVIYYEGTVEDITERKLAELQVQAALAEKEVLLREIHHRVKNNLAMISSLLELQARASGDARVKVAFQESQQRIRAMTQIHEQLYRSESLSTIDMSRYVSGLADELRYLYTRGEVAVQVDVEQVNLNIDQAIPCGLIINELVTNALKYAFPRQTEADKAGSSPDSHLPVRQVIIMLHALGEQCLLSISDNGTGMPSGLDIRTTRTLGLRLVSRLADQLGGSLTVNGEGHLAGKGTVFQILFPLRK